MRISQVLRIKFLLILFLFLASGCAYKPIALYDNDVYLGAFLKGKYKNPNIESAQLGQKAAELKLD